MITNKDLIFLFIIFTFISSCCSWSYNESDFEFSQNELVHFADYKIGDTLYFENNFRDIDTIAIVSIVDERQVGQKCAFSIPPRHNRRVLITHLPIDFWIAKKHYDGAGKDTVVYQTLFYIQKLPLENITNYGVSFKEFYYSDSTLGEIHKEISVSNKIIYNCYKLKHHYPERVINPTDISTVYWTDKYGLTAYTQKNGVTWFVVDADR